MEDEIEAPREKPKKLIGSDVFNTFKVYRYMAQYLLKKRCYEKSLLFYNIAQEWAEDKQLGSLLMERSQVYRALSEMKLALEDAYNAYKINPESLNIFYNLAKILYDADLFEDSLMLHHRGFKKRQLPDWFSNGILVATGTIENCIGRNAGNMMSQSKLGLPIVQLKKAELGMLPPLKQLSEATKIKQNNILEKKLNCYAEKYLGKIAKDRLFLKFCLQHKSLFMDDEKQNVMLAKLIEDALKSIEKIMFSLWQRKPLYTQENLSARLSSNLLRKQRQTKLLKMKLFQTQILKEMRYLKKLIREQKWTIAYAKAEILRNKLLTQSDGMLLRKKDYLTTIFYLLGEMYLSMKYLKDNWDEEKNDKRILFMLGIYKPYETIMELFRDSFHAPLPAPKIYIETIYQAMEVSDDSLEICYYNYELSCVYSMQKRMEIMRTYTRACIMEAKKCQNLIWYLNGLFQLARVEFQDCNLLDGKITLTAIKETAQYFKIIDVVKFVDRALFLLEKESDETLTGLVGIAKREKQLLRLMTDNELRNRCIKQLTHMNHLSPEMRMSIVPGLRPGEKTKKGLDDRKYVDTQIDELGKRISSQEQLHSKIIRRQTFNLDDNFGSKSTRPSITDTGIRIWRGSTFIDPPTLNQR